MAKRRTRLIRAGLVVAAISCVTFVARILLPREPTYEDQPFSYWVDRLPATITSWATVWPWPTKPPPETTNSLPAPLLVSISYLGTNAVLSDLEKIHQANAQTAAKAVDAVGADCLQVLVTRIKLREMPLRRTLSHWAVKLKLSKPLDPFTRQPTTDQRRLQAVTAIWLLGNRAQPIVPQLQVLSRHSDTRISEAAKCALEGIEMDGKGAQQFTIWRNLK